MPVATLVHPWSEQRKSVEKLREDRHDLPACHSRRPSRAASRSCGLNQPAARVVDLSTSACEIDQANEARSRNSRRYGAQLTVGACRQTRKQDMVFPSLSVPSAGARRHWTRSSSLLRRQPVWLGGGNGGTSWAPTRGARTTTAPWLMAGELVPVVSRHRRPQGGQGKAQLQGPVAGDGFAAERRKWAWLSFSVTIGDLLLKDVGTNSLDRWN